MPHSPLITCCGPLAELIDLYPVRCSREMYFKLLTGPLDCLCIAVLGSWPEKTDVFLAFSLRSEWYSWVCFLPKCCQGVSWRLKCVHPVQICVFQSTLQVRYGAWRKKICWPMCKWFCCLRNKLFCNLELPRFFCLKNVRFGDAERGEWKCRDHGISSARQDAF